MKLSTWRPSLLSWLQSQVTVDSWMLDTPDRPGVTVGFLPPLRDSFYELTSPVEVTTAATQDIYILKSYAGSLSYQDLPIATLEGFYQTLAIRLVHDWKDLHGELSELQMIQVPTPVAVKEIPDERSDWLIEMVWSFRIVYMATPEVGTIQPPFPLQGVFGGIYRSHLEDFEDHRLDFTWDSIQEP